MSASLITRPTLRKPQEQRVQQSPWMAQPVQRNMAPPNEENNDGEFDFPAEVDKIDSVPKSMQSLYAKDGGVFKLHAGIAARLDNSGLTSALQKERTRAKELEKSLGAYKAFGEPAKVKEALDALAALEKGGEGDEGGEEGGEKAKRGFVKERAKMKADYEKLLADKDAAHKADLDRLQGALRKHVIDAQVTQAISAAEGIPELLLPIITRQCLLSETDGVYAVQVVDAAGDPRVGPKGGDMTVAELVAELRASETYGRAFKSTGKSGSGKPPTAGKGGTPGERLSPVEKISRGLNKI